MQRWVLTAHERAAMTQSCRQMAGLEDKEKSTHKEASKSRTKTDEGCVGQVVACLMNQANPFQSSADLVSLMSG